MIFWDIQLISTDHTGARRGIDSLIDQWRTDGQAGGGWEVHSQSKCVFVLKTDYKAPSVSFVSPSHAVDAPEAKTWATLLSWVIEFELCVSSYIKIWTDQQQLQVIKRLFVRFCTNLRVLLLLDCCHLEMSWKCIFLFVVLNRQNYNLLMIKIRSNKVPQRGNCHVTAEWANVYHNRKQKQIRKTRLIKLWKHKQNRKQLQYILIHTPIAPVSMFMLLH